MRGIDHTNLQAFVRGEAGPPISSSFLGDFARYLHDERGVPTTATVSSYVNDVARFCERQLGVRPEVPPHLKLALDREGGARPVSKAKDPASPSFVAALLADLTIPLVLRAAAATIWHASLRGADVLSKHVGKPSLLHFRRRDLTFAPDLSYARLVFRKGKALRKNQANVRLIVSPTDDEPWAIDPIAILLEYLHSTAADDPEAPLFRHENGALATKTHLRNAIKRKAEAMGLDPTRLGCHSLRSGGNTTMHALEVPDADVQQQGGWLSAEGDCPYRRRNVAQARRAQTALRLPAAGHTLPAPLQVHMVTASSPLLAIAAALDLTSRVNT